jgi:hypothetical protein
LRISRLEKTQEEALEGLGSDNARRHGTVADVGGRTERGEDKDERGRS